MHVGTADTLADIEGRWSTRAPASRRATRYELRAAPSRRSPAGPGPRRRTAGPSRTTPATARPGSSTTPGNRTPPPGSATATSPSSTPTTTGPATRRTPAWSRRCSTCPARPPEIGFDTDYNGIRGQVADVDLSADGGHDLEQRLGADRPPTSRATSPSRSRQAAGQANVQVRFHFTGDLGLVVGSSTTCSSAPAPATPTGGGLVAGIVRDGNTGAAAERREGPSDAHAGPSSGSRRRRRTTRPSRRLLLAVQLVEHGQPAFHATDGKYTPATAQVNVGRRTVATQKNWTLQGRAPAR